MKVQNLNGIWQFAYSEEKPENPVFDSFVSVPSCFDNIPGRAGVRACGCYKRNINCSGKVMLTVEGAGLHYEVFVDGRSVGKSILAYSKEEFFFDCGNITEHELVIIADNKIYSDDLGETYKVYYDFYGFGGIYSDIYLTEYADDDIRRIEVIPQDINKGTALIRLETFGANPDEIMISFDGKTSEKRPFAQEFTVNVPDFKLWSVETPYLHTVRINGVEAEFGMRTLDWSGNDLLLNGKVLKLVGCNRHESHPAFGAAVPESLIADDLQMIKEQGFNFVRGSHYPQKESLLRLCDRMGILVWEEALGWGNRKEHLADAAFGDNQAEQCRKMVRKSINHPSVIIWGFLNEAHSEHPEAADLLRRLYNTIREMDPSRPITFACNRPKSDICMQYMDIFAINIYPGWYDTADELSPRGSIANVKKYIDMWGEKFQGKPLMIGEIGSAALYGDHSGYRWSEEYQADHLEEVLKCVLNNPRYTGVGIWLFADAKSYLETEYFFTRPRGFNNKGMLNEYRLPKVSWYRTREYLRKFKESVKN